MTVVTWQAMRTIVSRTNPCSLFPGACKMANGDVLLSVPLMTHHLYGDGELWTMTGADNGNGTVTWREDWSKIYARKGGTWDVRGGLPALVPSGPHAGKVVIAVSDTNWYAGSILNYLAPYPTTKVQCFCRILISTDETCTAWTELATLPPAFPALVADNCQNDFPEGPVVFLPNGDWMVATYSRETHDYIGWYSAAYFRSTDNGATWEHEGFVSRANTANPDQSTAYQADEPQLLMLDNGEMLCVIRALAEGRPANGSSGHSHDLYRCENPTDAGNLTWTFEGGITTSQANSRPALMQHGSGMVVHGYRTIIGGLSCQGAYRTSDDYGATWGTERNLDTGAVTGGATGSVYSYGAWVQLDNGGLLHVYCNDNAASSTTREARMSTDWTPTYPPSVTGSDAANITTTTASIVGNVNPNGAATTYHVEYGETTGYGSSTSPVSAGSGSSPVAAEVGLTGLDPDTAYHARLVATSANGTTNGPDIPFTTDAAPPPDVGLTIDPANTAWEQDETQLTVQAGHNARSITEATVESLSGGTLVYSGGDSAKFSVSLNGTTWTPTVTVPAGTTVIYLSVLPDSDDTTLTTSVGVPI